MRTTSSPNPVSVETISKSYHAHRYRITTPFIPPKRNSKSLYYTTDQVARSRYLTNMADMIGRLNRPTPETNPFGSRASSITQHPFPYRAYCAYGSTHQTPGGSKKTSRGLLAVKPENIRLSLLCSDMDTARAARYLMLLPRRFNTLTVPFDSNSRPYFILGLPTIPLIIQPSTLYDLPLNNINEKRMRLLHTEASHPKTTMEMRKPPNQQHRSCFDPHSSYCYRIYF